MKINYKPWLILSGGIKPHLSKHDGSFNNVVYTAELLLGLLELDNYKQDAASVIGHFLATINYTETIDGGYAPKDSHDNLTAKIVGLKAIENKKYLNNMNLDKLNRGKHPRDRILYRFWLSKGIKKLLWGLLLPIALLDIIRAIFDSGKVRPKWWGSFQYFKIRVGAALGLYKQIDETKIVGGIAKFYETKDSTFRVIYVQNDGKIISLLRLHALKEHAILRPFVRLCKKLYIRKLGKNFQSVLFENYFEEYEHPVRVVFRELDKSGKTIIDC